MVPLETPVLLAHAGLRTPLDLVSFARSSCQRRAVAQGSSCRTWREAFISSPVAPVVAAAGLMLRRRFCAARSGGAVLCRRMNVVLSSAQRCAEAQIRVPAPKLLNKLVTTTPFKSRSERSRLGTKEELNVGFMYLKPHANTEKTRAFMKQRLRSRGLQVIEEGSIMAEAIEERRIIDIHYGSLATKALAMKPSELLVQPEAKVAFEKCFGLSWESALSQDLVCNASEAMLRRNWTADELCELWDPLQLGIGKVKFGGGFYCGKIDNLYIINGFYLSMQRKYTRPGSSVHYFVVSWKPSALSWKDFRKELLGNTDPTRAGSQTLRGQIFTEWKELGLPEEPNGGDNAVHASASPFEALAERMNWLASPLAQDCFGKQLLGAGIPVETVKHWCSDPEVDHAGRRQSLFDLFEDAESKECVEFAQRLHSLR